MSVFFYLYVFNSRSLQQRNATIEAVVSSTFLYLETICNLKKQLTFWTLKVKCDISLICFQYFHCFDMINILIWNTVCVGQLPTLRRKLNIFHLKIVLEQAENLLSPTTFSSYTAFKWKAHVATFVRLKDQADRQCLIGVFCYRFFLRTFQICTFSTCGKCMCPQACRFLK
jgi:hypothetical protein